MENYYLKKTHKKTEKSGTGLDSCQAPGGAWQTPGPGLRASHCRGQPRTGPAEPEGWPPPGVRAPRALNQALKIAIFAKDLQSKGKKVKNKIAKVHETALAVAARATQTRRRKESPSGRCRPEGGKRVSLAFRSRAFLICYLTFLPIHR